MPGVLRALFDQILPPSAGVCVEVEDERLLVWRVCGILGVIETGPPRADDD
ncbi:MAG: hypothetical protein LC749_14715 [Actinobacteria bacterium]|nr:hypothetical protein [Actinomycetota bacterium]